MTDFSYEDSHQGIVVGIDEVGRGPLAGPVVAASVFIPENIRSQPFIAEIKDSKKLSKPKLKKLNTLIHQNCSVSIAEHSPEDIDELNILQASLSAMLNSCLNLKGITPTFALIDGNKIPKNMPCEAASIIKGDSISKSIAAASIVAKFYRDTKMEHLALDHPEYGWNTNVGYPTAQHRAAILEFGITPHHRKSFAPIRSYMESNIKNIS